MTVLSVIHAQDGIYEIKYTAREANLKAMLDWTEVDNMMTKKKT